MSFFNALLSSSKTTYDTDAAAYFTAVEAIEGELPVSNKIALNTFVLNVKAAGLWTPISFMWISFAETLAGAMVPLKTTASNMTNVSFVENEYTPTYGILRYIISTAKSIATGVTIASPITGTNISGMVHSNINEYVSAVYLYGASNAVNNYYMNTAFATPTISIRNGSNTSGAATAEGDISHNRTTGPLSTLYKAGVSIGTSAGSSTVETTNAITLLGLNTSGTVSQNIAPGALDFMMLGQFISGANLAVLSGYKATLRASQMNYYNNL